MTMTVGARSLDKRLAVGIVLLVVRLLASLARSMGAGR